MTPFVTVRQFWNIAPPRKPPSNSLANRSLGIYPLQQRPNNHCPQCHAQRHCKYAADEEAVRFVRFLSPSAQTDLDDSTGLDEDLEDLDKRRRHSICQATFPPYNMFSPCHLSNSGNGIAI
jgi:hypothetical protein